MTSGVAPSLVVSPERRRVGVALVAVMAAIAASQWHVVFGWRGAAPLVPVAVVAVGVTLAAGSPRRSLAFTGAVSLGVLVVVLAGLGREPSPAGIVDGLVNGWSRIVSTTLAVPTDEGRILLPAAVVWLAGFVGAESALRLRRWPAVAAVPPLLAYGAALPFGGGAGGAGWAVALLVAGLATVRVLSPPTPTEPAATGAGGGMGAQLPRRVAGMVVFLGVAAAVGLLVGAGRPVLDGADPYDPRADQRPPLDDVVTIDPLSLLAGWALDREDPVLFTADGPAADRWRLAVLDRYDPASGWSSRARYVAAGSRVPEPDVPDTTRASGPPVERTVTVGELDGIWLPTTGRPAGVDGPEVHVDPSSTMLVTGDGLARGQRYRLTSDPGRVSEDCSSAGLPVAPPPTGDDAALTGEIVAYATGITRGATSQCAQAELIEQYLRSDNFTFSAEAPSGATLARTIELLQVGEDPSAGTSEQFATAFALLARASGMDARVAVGFRPGEAADDVHRVHASDAYAWVEVRFGRLGWVSFDPTPGSGDEESRSETSTPPVTPSPNTTAAPVTTAPVPATLPTTTTTVARDSAASGESAGGFDPVVLAVGVLAGLVALVAVAIAVVRRRRRAARRRAVAAADRVIGAWRQCLVELRDGGLPLEEANTVGDYVAATRRVLGPELADELDSVARLANRALFSGRATDEDAVQAWRSTDALAAALVARRSPTARARHAFDVRALARS